MPKMYYLSVKGQGYLCKKSDKLEIVKSKEEASLFSEWEARTLKNATVIPEASEEKEPDPDAFAICAVKKSDKKMTDKRYAVIKDGELIELVTDPNKATIFFEQTMANKYIDKIEKSEVAKDQKFFLEPVEIEEPQGLHDFNDPDL